MSIQSELTRLTNAKAAIQAAIEGKGVTVPADTLLDGMASLIESIEAGGGGAGNIATGSYTISAIYSSAAMEVMTVDEWAINYGDFPTTLYAAYFDENPGEITSGYVPLYCASCIVDGNAQKCYATVYSNTKISYMSKTTAIAHANENNNYIQIIGGPSPYNFAPGRTYRWVIIW